jgi:hypothetical protein
MQDMMQLLYDSDGHAPSVNEAGLGMKCPGIYKQVKRNQCRLSSSIPEYLGSVLYESPCIMIHQTTVIIKKHSRTCNITIYINMPHISVQSRYSYSVLFST